MRAISKGIRQTPHGWQVYAKVNGKFVSEHFKRDTTISALKKARNMLIARERIGVEKPDPDQPTFTDDVETYLAMVGAMPSFQDRAYHMRQWASVFGQAQRKAITTPEIRAQLEIWRAKGSVEGGPLTAASLNRRRTALMSFYRALEGRGGPNPVTDVPKYSEHASEALRAIRPRLAYRLIARLGRKRRPSKTRARLFVMLWTGWPQKQIAQLKPEHLDLKRSRVWVTSRQKGKGVKGRWIPVLPGAVHALEKFVAAGAFGPFSASAMHTAFVKALTAENAARERKKLRPVSANPYSLRHTFGTELAKRLTDERVIQTLMLHSTPGLTRRYTEGATEERLASALATLATSERPVLGNRGHFRTPVKMRDVRPKRRKPA